MIQVSQDFTYYSHTSLLNSAWIKCGFIFKALQDSHIPTWVYLLVLLAKRSTSLEKGNNVR